jgi:hypothetical protein
MWSAQPRLGWVAMGEPKERRSLSEEAATTTALGDMAYLSVNDG